MKISATWFAPPLSIGHFTQMVSRLAFGNTVCFTDVAFSCAMFFMPGGSWFFMSGLALTVVVWLIIALFPITKAAVDVHDLCFYQCVGWLAALGLYKAGINPVATWYVIVALQILKVIRVYAPMASTTAKVGWAVFGPVTYWFGRKTNSALPTSITVKSYVALFLAILFAAGGSILDQRLSETNRLLVALVCPLLFTILDGPRLIFSWLHFAKAFPASTANQEPEKAIPATLPKHEVPLGETASLSPEVLAQFMAAYGNIHPGMHPHLMDYLHRMSEIYPAPKPPVDR